MSVRISAHDWVEGGITPDDAVEIARAFKAAGADLIDCSSGQVSKQQKPVYGRMYQTPFADRIRNEAGIATIAVGAISEADHVNSIIAAGRADLCAVARPHLANPAWTLIEAAQIGYTERRVAEAVPLGQDRSSSATSSASGSWPAQGAGLSRARAGQQGARRMKHNDPSHALLEDAQELGHEARAGRGDHAALKLWLRMLASTTQIEAEIRRRLRERFDISLRASTTWRSSTATATA